MNLLRRYRHVIVAGAAVVLLVGFLLFRPDKLFIDDIVDEQLEEAFADLSSTEPPTTGIPTTTTGPEPDPIATATSLPTKTTTATASPGPSLIRTGSWLGIGHTAEGTASIYTQDGRNVLRFEDDTEIQNGPDLYVWLLADDGYIGGTPIDYIDLGKIKGNVGGQNYDLPEAYDPNIHKYVLIWCLRFSEPFAGAPLT